MSSAEIAPTGWWAPQTAHIHHCHSPRLADWLARFFTPGLPVSDLGCGLGHYALALRHAGFTVRAYDGRRPDRAVLPDIIEHDLADPIPDPLPGHCLCLEVGEHIPPPYQGRFVENLARCTMQGAFLVLSWGVPGQAGFGHVNCLPNEVVAGLLARRGFLLRDHPSAMARLAGSELPWFQHSLMVFQRMA